MMKEEEEEEWLTMHTKNNKVQTEQMNTDEKKAQHVIITQFISAVSFVTAISRCVCVCPGRLSVCRLLSFVGRQRPLSALCALAFKSN